MAPPRKWSQEEQDRVVHLYRDKGWTARKIAESLGLKLTVVEPRIARMKLGCGKWKPIERLDELVKRFHARGLNDKEITAVLSEHLHHDVYTKSVWLSRRRQGLSSNYNYAKHRAKLAESMRRSVRLGLSVTKKRYDNQRDESARQGWPPVTERLRTVMQVLEQLGEPDTDQVIEWFRTNGGRNSWTCYCRVLFDLCNLGYVMRWRGRRDVPRKWRLSDSVKELRERWKIESRPTNEEN